MLALREAQKATVKKKKDRAILHTLAGFKIFQNSTEFFSYISYKGEVDTSAIIKKHKKSKQVLLPAIESKLIRVYHATDPHDTVPGLYGIHEPRDRTHPHMHKHIEVALIPAVAFDSTGHRIGYGKGYFDRFLKRVDCTTIGLAYEFQIIDKLPHTRYDVPVDFIVTERRIIQCHSSKNKTQR